ncbi:hypothetical protein niasHT_023772 [Heterodera trifolii]|uniref:Uncharacterized protein n=1 Tax=Heterodera trifolii TaxID=157864 RepID=A0ABD2JP44_9BILA
MLLIILPAFIMLMSAPVVSIFHPTVTNAFGSRVGNDYALNLSNRRASATGVRRAAESRQNIEGVPMPSQNGAENSAVVDAPQLEEELLLTGSTPSVEEQQQQQLQQEEEEREDEMLHIHGMEQPPHQQQIVAGTASTSAAHATGVASVDDMGPAAASNRQNRPASGSALPRSRAQSPDADAGPPYASTPTLCPTDENPTFLRHLWLPEEPEGTERTANFVRKMDSLEACARLCRDNVEPFGGRHFACHGFTYIGQRNARNACEFFDDHLAAALEKKPPLGAFHQQGQLLRADMAPQFPKNYFERICLGLPSRCARLPFAFDVHPRKALHIPTEAKPLGVEQVDDRKQCLQQCLNTKGCRSLDFDTANLTCSLYAHSLHMALGAPEESTWPLGQLVENVDLDHYENTCLTALDRCGGRHLAFVLIRNAELAGFSVGLGKMSVSECLSRCLDSPPAFCRAIQFRTPGNECFLGTERPFAPLPSDDMDIFEPVCLPDPPRTSILECHGEHVFERVPNMELRMDEAEDVPIVGGGGGGMEQQQQSDPGLQYGTDMSGLTLERCLDACILDESCVSLIFRPFSGDDNEQRNGTTGAVSGAISMCRLFPFGKMDNRTLSVIHPNVDYFELSCNRMPLSSAMRKMITVPPLPPAQLEEKDHQQKKKQMTTNKAKEKQQQQVDTAGGEKGKTEQGQMDTVVANDTKVGEPKNKSSTMREAEEGEEAQTPNIGTSNWPTLASVGQTTASFAFGSSTTAPASVVLSEQLFHATGGSADHQNSTLSPLPTESDSKCSAKMLHSLLFGRGRTLKLEQRQQHHRNVADALHCERLCADADDVPPSLAISESSSSFTCLTFAYSGRSHECLLSSTRIKGGAAGAAELELFSQADPDFDLYSFVDGQMDENCGDKWSTTTASSTASVAVNGIFDIERPFATNESAAAVPSLVTTTQNATTETFMENALDNLDKTLTTAQYLDNGVQQAVAATQPSPLQPPTAKVVTILTEKGSTKFVEPAMALRHSLITAPTKVSNKSSRSTTISSSTSSRTTMRTTSPTTLASSNSSNFVHQQQQSNSWMAPPAPISVDGNVVPSMEVPNGLTSGGGAAADRLSAEQIRAGVICDPQGLNVTFRLVGRAAVRYTGVVYAADRFAHCRLFVEEATEFAFYVNRPGVGQSNWCNSVETNEELNVVLVMSNDEVFPLDVTTSDDLFFHVSCDFRGIGVPTATGGGTPPQRHRLSAWPGSVSGPEPGPLFASAARRPQKSGQLLQRRPLADPETGQRRERVHLKILRDGRPVSSVYIGERLSAVVESTDVEVERLRVADCNATRVGGRVPRPSSIPLLDRAGCSLNPHIIGHMRRYPNRLEAPLNAFRIDGSDQIDIICAVLVCRNRCASRENQCPAELDHRHTGTGGAAESLRVHRASSSAGGAGKITLQERSLADLPSVAGDFLTVDQRIRVLVSEEEEEAERTLAVADAEAIDERPLAPRAGAGGNVLSASVADAPVAGPGTTDILLGGMASSAASGDLCLNPVALLFLMVLLLLTVASLIVSLLAHWCQRKNGRRSSHTFYPAPSTELSSHHFHIPRVLDRRTSYMG